MMILSADHHIQAVTKTQAYCVSITFLAIIKSVKLLPM